MNGSTGIRILSLAVLGLLVSNLISEKWTLQLDQIDRALIHGYFGVSKANAIEQEVHRLFDAGSNASHFKAESLLSSSAAAAAIPIASPPELGEVLAWIEGRIHLAEKMAERLIRRLLVIMEFDGIGILLTVLFVIDGLLKWKVGKTNFTYPSPLAHRITIFALGSFICLFPLALLTPIPLLTAPFPVLWLMIGFTLKAHVSHLPKRL